MTFNTGKNPRNGRYATISTKNPRRVVGGYKSWNTRQKNAASDPDLMKALGSVISAIGAIASSFFDSKSK